MFRERGKERKGKHNLKKMKESKKERRRKRKRKGERDKDQDHNLWRHRWNSFYSIWKNSLMQP